MQIFRSLAEVPAEGSGRAVSIGNFDGVHMGHKALLRRNVELARERDWTPTVLTFDPHPMQIVAPERAPKLLTTMEQRLALLAAEGVEQAVVLRFDSELAATPPERFVLDVLVHALRTRAVLVGDNFRFGAKHAGDVNLLRRMGDEFGFCTEVVQAVTIRGRVASSSEVREAVIAGRVSAAVRLLGRPYALEGRVVSGHGIGSKQTVPTLNLDTTAEVLPAGGVYVTETTDTRGGRRWPSITNVGIRPTFDGDRLTVETYLLTPLEGENPEQIRVAFLRRLREERKFDSPAALKGQIMKDVGRAQAWFRRMAAASALRRP